MNISDIFKGKLRVDEYLFKSWLNGAYSPVVGLPDALTDGS